MKSDVCQIYPFQLANDDRIKCNQYPAPVNVSPLSVDSTLECCMNEYVSRFSTGKSEMKRKRFKSRLLGI